MTYRKTFHAVYDLKYHLVWITKYRKPVMRGEHGIGLLKTGYVPKSVDPLALEMMRQVK